MRRAHFLSNSPNSPLGPTGQASVPRAVPPPSLSPPPPPTAQPPKDKRHVPRRPPSAILIPKPARRAAHVGHAPERCGSLIGERRARRHGKPVCRTGHACDRPPATTIRKTAPGIRHPTAPNHSTPPRPVPPHLHIRPRSSRARTRHCAVFPESVPDLRRRRHGGVQRVRHAGAVGRPRRPPDTGLLPGLRLPLYLDRRGIGRRGTLHCEDGTVGPHRARAVGEAH